MPVQFTYNGPYEAVEIPAAGLLVRKGETVELPDDLAAGLVDQGEAWHTDNPDALRPAQPAEDTTDQPQPDQPQPDQPQTAQPQTAQPQTVTTVTTPQPQMVQTEGPTQ